MGVTIPTMAELAAKGEKPEILFWVGCAASFDDRARKIAQAFVRILNAANVKFAILGNEERCTGDPARRAGNEFVFQMAALQNIELLNGYGIEKIVTLCPHCYNTFKNEYPDLGGNYEVWHAVDYALKLIEEGRLKIKSLKEIVTLHDPCYLGRINDKVDEPRELLSAIGLTLKEMPRHGKRSFCCGAGGAQIFKEEEEGREPVYRERAREALQTGAKTIVTACPFCMIMLRDGVRDLAEGQAEVKDIIELLSEGLEDS